MAKTEVKCHSGKRGPALLLGLALALLLTVALPAAVGTSVAQAATSEEAKPELMIYKIRRGDTLWDLARKYGTTVAAIAQWSGIREDSLLRIGQTVKIPVKPAAKAATPAAATDETTAASASVAAAPAVVTTTATATSSDRPQPLTSRGGDRGAVAIPWEEAQNIFKTGGKARVTDVETGYSFMVVRRGGWAHADVEPVTKQDTQIMKKVWGAWSWSRRPVVVEVGDKRIAASMAGMPHGGEVVTDNGVLGHVDLHFLNSTTHGSVYTKNRKPTLDPAHQAAVRAAVGK